MSVHAAWAGLRRGLDYALDEARKRGLRVLLSLTDNWQPTGGADAFVRWSGTATTHEDFFSDPTCKQLYKDHVRTVLTRPVAGRARRGCSFRFMQLGMGRAVGAQEWLHGRWPQE